jgi:hypothetical protein
MLAAVKPRKWIELGLSARLRTVATIPVNEAAPSFLVHHMTRASIEIPIMSQRIGRCVMFQKEGPIVTFSIAHRAAQSEIAARFFALNFNHVSPVLLFL